MLADILATVILTLSHITTLSDICPGIRLVELIHDAPLRKEVEAMFDRFRERIQEHN
jgi:hypothetical protein